MYIVDTNVYVTAANDPEARARFEEFLDRHGPLPVSAVVASEVMLGVSNTSKHARVVQALSAGTMVVAPSMNDWLRAATTITELGGETVTKSRSFWNDALLAAQCARLGFTLVTHNLADFRRLARQLDVRAVRPFP